MILYGKSDTGMKRKVNQDSFTTLEYAENATLVVVCDGMGGNAGGSEASRIAVETFVSHIRSFLDSIEKKDNKIVLKGENIKKALARALVKTNTAVYEAAAGNAELSGMGTTLVAALIVDSMLYSVNVGDSRLYSSVDKKLTQLTRDHSYVQYLVDLGKISPDEAKTNTHKNIITRAVGTEPELEGDINVHELPEGVAVSLLLCSDGLSNMVPESEIEDVLAASVPIDIKVNALVNQANNNGGPDNITAVIAEIS